MKQSGTILFVTQFYYPHIGGVEKHVSQISRQLLTRKNSITILTEQYDNSLPLTEIIDGVSVIRIPIGNSKFLKKFYIWKWIFFHFDTIRDAKIIHVHDVFYYLLPFRLFIFSKKIFMTFHGYEGFPVKKRWVISRKIAETLTAGNICVGDFMKKWYFTKPTKIIYGAVSTTKLKNIRNAQSAVFFGRLDDQTGILEYVAAYKKIKKIYPKFKFTVVGEGNLRQKLPKDIKTLPFTHKTEEYISNNRFIFVSRYLSILEALIQKREVIAVYDNPIKKDYLMMSPFKEYISVAGNSGDIARIVLNKLKNKHNGAQLGKGYEFARQLSWQNLAKIYLKLWEIRN